MPLSLKWPTMMNISFVVSIEEQCIFLILDTNPISLAVVNTEGPRVLCLVLEQTLTCMHIYILGSDL